MRAPAAQKALEAVEAELAAIRARIAPFRRALYAAREIIREGCIRSDHSRMAIRSWRPMNRDEVARLDAAHAHFREHTEHLLPEEARLNAGVKEATRALRNAEHEDKMDARRAAKSDRKEAQNDQPDLF